MSAIIIAALIIMIVLGLLLNQKTAERDRLAAELVNVKNRAEYNAQRAKTEAQKERAASELEKYEALRAKYIIRYGDFPDDGNS